MKLNHHKTTHNGRWDFGMIDVRRGRGTAPCSIAAAEANQLTWLALGRDQAGGSRSAEQVTAL